MNKDIVTPLRWKRPDEEKPPLDKTVWGLFVSEEGSRIEKMYLHRNVLSGKATWRALYDNYWSGIPLLWSDPEDAIHSLMGSIDGKGEHHADTR